MVMTVKDRVVVYLDEKERAALQRLHEKTGAPMAELLRRALRLYLKKEGGR
jgi:hypothetical protein